MSSVTLFTYGTLCVSEVMQAVSGKTFKSEKAYLSGYQRYLVKDHVFPAIVPSAEQTKIDGMSYFNVDESALALIDEFESYIYDRTLVEVCDASNIHYEAYVYVLSDSYRHLLSEDAWDLEVFRERHLEHYLKPSDAE